MDRRRRHDALDSIIGNLWVLPFFLGKLLGHAVDLGLKDLASTTLVLC
jgi:hypothetical protein